MLIMAYLPMVSSRENEKITALPTVPQDFEGRKLEDISGVTGYLLIDVALQLVGGSHSFFFFLCSFVEGRYVHH